MRKLAAVSLIIAMLLFSGCTDSIIVQVAIDGAETKPAATTAATTVNPADFFDESTTHVTQRIYPGGTSAFYIRSDVKPENVVSFYLIDFVESTNDFIYYYCAEVSGSNYYQCVSVYNPFTKRQKTITELTQAKTAEAPNFQYAEGMNKCYFFTFAGQLYYYQYASDDKGGNITPFVLNDMQIFIEMNKAYFGGNKDISSAVCTGLYALNGGKSVCFAAMFYDSIDNITDEDIENGTDKISGEAYALWKADFETAANGYIQVVQNYQSLKACSFPTSGFFVYGINNQSYYVRAGTQTFNLGLSPSAVQGIRGIEIGNENYFVEYREDAARFYRLNAAIDSSGTITNMSMGNVLNISANLYSPVTNHSVLMLNAAHAAGANLSGLYSQNGKIRDGSYYAVFSYGTSGMIAVGFESSVSLRTTVTNSSGKVLSDTTENTDTLWSDIANARVYVYNSP